MLAYRSITTSISVTKLIPQLYGITAIRSGHRLRGARPGVAKTLQQRQEEIRLSNYDPEIEKKIDIGFPQTRLKRADELKKQGAFAKVVRADNELEKKARNLELEINLNDVHKEWMATNGPVQIKTIATHYGVYQDLFGRAYFLPRVPFKVKYKISEEEYAPVCYGNVLKPHQTKTEPEVSFDPRCNLIGREEGNTLWTLILTNPDGHFTENDKEYVHWFIGNIPNDDISKGEVIVPYLQPFPPKGTGFHRHIFVLYKQTKKIDFSEYKVEQLNDLKKRTFSTGSFYKKHEDHITPGSLAFFQSDYDSSLTEFYHNVLEIKEPIYEYDFPGPYIRDDKLFPLRQPFNLYLDKHRDQKQIAKEFLERKLKKTHPFDGPEAPLKFPNVHSIDKPARFETDLQRGRVKGNNTIHVPSWLKTEIRKARLGWGRINEFKSRT